MNTLEDFLSTYETVAREMTIGGRSYTFRLPLSIDGFIDSEDPMNNFPLWARIWEASLVLAEHLAEMPMRTAGSILEIGAGIGVAGIVAASWGHKVTVTEYNKDAFAFARANADINGCQAMQVQLLDWNAPVFQEPFDTITGSEVLYHERDFDPLLKLFTRFLKPGGKIFLAMKPRHSALLFFDRAREIFNISMKKIDVASADECTPVYLCRMQRKHEEV
jgi:predicted nicotinamide N-methyase